MRWWLNDNNCDNDGDDDDAGDDNGDKDNDNNNEEDNDGDDDDAGSVIIKFCTSLIFLFAAGPDWSVTFYNLQVYNSEILQLFNYTIAITFLLSSICNLIKCLSPRPVCTMRIYTISR